MKTHSVATLPRLAACIPMLAVSILAAGLGACSRKAETTGSITTLTDLRERHPVVLTNAPLTLDVFVGRAGAGLDSRQELDVADFGMKFRSQGRGALMVQVPTGAGFDAAAQRTVSSIRTILARNGVAGSALVVSKYQTYDPELAAPVRLTYAALQAKVSHACGQWPDDLGVTHTSNWRSNESYWNLGCANQATLAAQIADPVDLVRGRPEGKLDTGKRMMGIGKFREGEDSSTQYREQGSSINKAVGSP